MIYHMWNYWKCSHDQSSLVIKGPMDQGQMRVQNIAMWAHINVKLLLFQGQIALTVTHA